MSNDDINTDSNNIELLGPIEKNIASLSSLNQSDNDSKRANSVNLNFPNSNLENTDVEPKFIDTCKDNLCTNKANHLE